MSPHQWSFSSRCYKPYPSSSSTTMANSALNFSAASVVGQCQPSSLRSCPAQPADLWSFPPTGTPSVTGSVYPHTLPDLYAADELISDRKYSSLLGLLQQERCLTSMQECTMKQHSSSACMTGPARLQNMSQSSAPGGGKKILSLYSLMTSDVKWQNTTVCCYTFQAGSNSQKSFTVDNPDMYCGPWAQLAI